ncbi:MAG: hypothetical protein M1813_009542 [Trichoglossum hirsutum]|nr:MAG: hypothetical protein M1813_009542 [Trichoglossum hirsutum]
MLMLRRLHHSTSVNGAGLDMLLLSGLLHSTDLGCLDPRDRIYSLLGLMSEDPRRPVPNRSLSFEEVYTDFARYFVQAGFGTQLIATASLSKPRLGLPSWCPDWSCNRRNTERANFSSSIPESLEERVVLHQNALLIIADGCLLDKITNLGPPLESSNVEDMYTDYRAWYHASESLLNSAVTSKYKEDGDALLLWCRFITIKSSGNMTVSRFLGFHDAIWNEQDLHEAMRRLGSDAKSPAAEVEGSNEKEIEKSATVQGGDSIREENNGEETKPTLFVPDSDSWRCLLSFCGKRLCVTARGYLGMLNVDTQVGDIVSVMALDF